jgi:hypothetical protein
MVIKRIGPELPRAQRNVRPDAEMMESIQILQRYPGIWYLVEEDSSYYWATKYRDQGCEVSSRTSKKGYETDNHNVRDVYARWPVSELTKEQKKDGKKQSQ